MLAEMRKDSKRNMIIISCIALVLILFITCAVINKEKANEIRDYKESFESGCNLGVGINLFDMRCRFDPINENEYDAFLAAYNMFYENPSEENFEKLTNILKTRVEDISFNYGTNLDGFMHGCYVGDTKTSVKRMHILRKISDEMFEEFNAVLYEVLQNPGTDSFKVYDEFIHKIYETM